MHRRPFISILLAAGALLLSAAPAAAITTIGQLAPGPSPPPAGCGSGAADLVQPVVVTGQTYEVPENGALISSWSTFATPGADQTLTLKVFRKITGIGDPNVWEVIGHDGPRPLVPGVVNTFQTHLPVRTGDLVGLNTQSTMGSFTACVFDVPGESLRERIGNLADGQNGTFNQVVPDSRLNLTATVLTAPSNFFLLGQVDRNKERGTATIAVQVPGPGTLSLSGRGVQTQRVPGDRAVVSKTVGAAGTATLRVKAKGGKKRRLNRRGQVRVGANITYVPFGDIPGEPKTLSHRIRLVKQD
jgi:hypothetical protein